MNELASQGVVVTKRRKPIANVIPVRGSLADRFADVDDDVAVHPDDDLLTTGAWFSDEWGDLQDG